MQTRKRRLVGHVGVDSGLVAVGDPVYLAEQDGRPDWLPNLKFTDLLGDEVSEQLDENGAAQVIDDGVVACRSGYGDGVYPVYVEYAETDPRFGGNERPAKLIVEFIPEEEE